MTTRMSCKHFKLSFVASFAGDFSTFSHFNNLIQRGKRRWKTKWKSLRMWHSSQSHRAAGARPCRNENRNKRHKSTTTSSKYDPTKATRESTKQDRFDLNTQAINAYHSHKSSRMVVACYGHANVVAFPSLPFNGASS